MYSSGELFFRSRVILVLIFQICTKTTNRYIKIAFEWTHKQFARRVYTLFNFLHDIPNPWMMRKTRIFTHRPRVPLPWFTFCWWCYNRLLMTSRWPDDCDAFPWKVVSNSSDINFIHGNMHGRSCKKLPCCVTLNATVQVFIKKIFFSNQDQTNYRDTANYSA